MKYAAAQVDIDDAVEIGRLVIVEIAPGGQAGVAHADIQSTEARERLGDEAAHGIDIGDIARDWEAVGAGFRSDGVGGVLGAPRHDIVEQYIRAFRAELPRHFVADALAGAGDDGGLICESHLCHNPFTLAYTVNHLTTEYTEEKERKQRERFKRLPAAQQAHRRPTD